MTTACEQPRHERVRIPHLPRSELVASPRGRRYLPNPVEHGPRLRDIATDPQRTAGGFGDVADLAVTPASDLVPEQPGDPEPAGADGPHTHDSPLGAPIAPHRGHLDHEPVRSKPDLQGRVVELPGIPVLAMGHHRLEGAAVQADRTPTGAKGQPDQTHAPAGKGYELVATCVARRRLTRVLRRRGHDYTLVEDGPSDQGPTALLQHLDCEQTVAMKTKDAAADFLSQRRIAVTGVSRTPKDHGANVVYRRLRDRGYEVFAVNPGADTVEGDACYPNLHAIPGGVDAVVIGTRPEHALETIKECIDVGIDKAWMHRGPGAGSVSTDATDLGRLHGMLVIDGGCPCMYRPTSDPAHRVMRTVLTLTGSVPRAV